MDCKSFSSSISTNGAWLRGRVPSIEESQGIFYSPTGLFIPKIQAGNPFD